MCAISAGDGMSNELAVPAVHFNASTLQWRNNLEVVVAEV